MLGWGPRPGVERSGTPGSLWCEERAREVGDSYSLYSAVSAFARFARSAFLSVVTWGFASLHPRLYAYTRSAGFGKDKHVLACSELPKV